MKSTNKNYRSGFIALLGRPNSGKSTLLNTILGEQLAVVTPLPQTTRRNMKGIFSDNKMQLVFIDTPGIHEGKHLLNKEMNQNGSGLITGKEIDLILYLVDLSRGFGAEEDYIVKIIGSSPVPTIIIFNKEDLCTDIRQAKKIFYSRYNRLSTLPNISLCSKDPKSRKTVLDFIIPFIPKGPFYYPGDDITDENLRYFAAEFIRKHIIYSTKEEVPHASIVEIIEYKENKKVHGVEAVIHVETEGQKGIIIGKNGRLIKQIRKQAEADLSRLTGCPSSIKCHVKITPKWRDNRNFLLEMGLGH